MKIERFEDIESWQLARDLVREVYASTREKPFSSDWALKDQILRSAGSAMHNIAEGFDGGSSAEFARFLGYSQRSCREVQSQLYVALDQEYIDEGTFQRIYAKASTIAKKVGGFIRYLVKSG